MNDVTAIDINIVDRNFKCNTRALRFSEITLDTMQTAQYILASDVGGLVMDTYTASKMNEIGNISKSDTAAWEITKLRINISFL